LADYAHCLAALIDALELGPAHVAGLSWGGNVVLELYRRHPELVATLIVVDTYAGWKGSLPEERCARGSRACDRRSPPADEFDPAPPGWSREIRRPSSCRSSERWPQPCAPTA